MFITCDFRLSLLLASHSALLLLLRCGSGCGVCRGRLVATLRRTDAFPRVTVGRAIAQRTFVDEIKVPRPRIGRGSRAQLSVQPRPRLRRIGRRTEQNAPHAQHGRFAGDRRGSVVVVVVDAGAVVVVVVDVAQGIGFGHEHSPAVVDGTSTVGGRPRHAIRNGHG